MGGGESINSIPRLAWLELDVRSTSAAVLLDLERTIRSTVAKAVLTENQRRLHGSTPVTAEITQLGSRPCGELDAGSPLVRLALDATRRIGANPKLAIGSTDASVPISMGIPAIAIGAGGRGGGTHTPGEWYDDTGGVRGLQRALLMTVSAANLR
jgi:di/tripeptidase